MDKRNTSHSTDRASVCTCIFYRSLKLKASHESPPEESNAACFLMIKDNRNRSFCLYMVMLLSSNRSLDLASSMYY